jgi:hypothetical protein
VPCGHIQLATKLQFSVKVVSEKACLWLPL